MQDQLEAALSSFADRAGAHGLRRPHRRRRACAEPGGALRRAGRARAVLLGARHQPLPAGRHRACSGARRWPTTSMRATARGAGATSTCCSSRRCGRRSKRARPAGCSARSMAKRCAPRPALLIGEHDFSSFRASSARRRRRSRRCARSAIARRGAYWRFDFDGQRLPAPHGAQHHGLPGRGRPGPQQRPAGWPRCWRRATATPRRRPSRPTACTSSARTTMQRMASPSARRPSIGSRPDGAQPTARTRIKICGLTREADVDAAVDAGADAVGFVLYPSEPAPRHVAARRRSWRARLAAVRDAGAACSSTRRAPTVDAACAALPAGPAAVPRRRDARTTARPPAGPTCGRRGWRRESIC